MDEGRIEVLTAEALEALERGDHVRAIAITDQLACEAPEDPLVHVLRARALLLGGDPDEALVASRRAVELDPSGSKAHSLLGVAAWRLGRLTLAQQSLETAVRNSGEQAGPLVDFAWFMASERGPRLAEDAALEAVAAAEQSSTAWAALGLVQLRLHRRDDAEESLRRALELDPNDPYAQYAMTRLLQDRRANADAVHLASILQDTPGTQAIVAEVRREAKQRYIARRLVERGAYPTIDRHDPSNRWWIWLVAAIVVIFVLLMTLQPSTPLAIFFCTFFPLLIFWFRRFWFE
ncbi:MAG: tetratricopeptide repeat protein [Thermoguttaceae bacterium]